MTKRIISLFVSVLLVISIIAVIPPTLQVSAAYMSAPEGIYEKVTNVSELCDGYWIIVCENQSTAMSMTQNNNNRGFTQITITNGSITLSSNTSVQGIYAKRVRDSIFTLNVGYDSDEHLIGVEKQNYLRTSDSIYDEWNIGFTLNGDAIITSDASRRSIKVNNSSNSKFFATYNDTYTSAYSVQIYKLISDTCEHENCISEILQEATCIQTGVIRYTCDDCGFVFTSELPFASHDYQESVSEGIEPTCIEAGIKVSVCQVCGNRKEETLPPTGHTFSSGVCLVCGARESSDTLLTFYEITDLQELSDEMTIIICSTDKNDSLVSMSNIQKTNNRDAVVVANYNDSGERCSVVMDTNSSVQVFTLNKVDNLWEFITSEGYLYAASSSSNWLKTRPESTDGNSKWTIAQLDESSLFFIASNGNYNRNQLWYNSPNNVFSCYSNKQPNIRIFALDKNTSCAHINKVNVSAISPTCTQSGYTSGVKCNDCGIIISGCEEIQPTGHMYGDATTNGDFTHTLECSVCGYVSTEPCDDYITLINNKTTCSECGYSVDADKYVAVTTVSNGYNIVLTDVSNDCLFVNENNLFLEKRIYDDHLISNKYLYLSRNLDAKLLVENYSNGRFRLTISENGNKKYLVSDDTQISLSSSYIINGEDKGTWSIYTDGLSVDRVHIKSEYNGNVFANGIFSDTYVCAHEETEIEQSVSSTCLTPSYAGLVVCSNCGLGFTYEQIGQIGSHDYEIVEEVQATCSEDGYCNKICSVCGSTFNEIYYATGEHEYNENHYCDVCGQRDPEYPVNLAGDYYIASKIGNSIYYLSNDGISSSEMYYSISNEFDENGVSIFTVKITSANGTVLGSRSFYGLDIFSNGKVECYANKEVLSANLYILYANGLSNVTWTEISSNSYKLNATDLHNKTFRFDVACDDSTEIKFVDNEGNYTCIVGNNVISGKSSGSSVYSTIDYTVIDYRFADFQNITSIPTEIDTVAEPKYVWTLSAYQNNLYSISATYKDSLFKYLGDGDISTAPYENSPALFNVISLANNKANVFIDVNGGEDKYLCLNTTSPRFALYGLGSGQNIELYLIPVTCEVLDCDHEVTSLVNNVDATCTTDGYTGDQVCNICGQILVHGTVIKAHHTPGEEIETNRTNPTCVTNGLVEYSTVCTVCGEYCSTRTDIIPKINHSFVNGECSMCHIRFKVEAIDMDLTEDARLRYHVIVPSAFTNVYAVFTLSESLSKTYVNSVEEYSTDSQTGNYIFTMPAMTPVRFGDSVSVVIYGTDTSGVEYECSFNEYSVKKYCEDQILANPSNTSLRTVLSDLLVYGKEAQLQWNYKTDNLVTENLADGVVLTPSEYTGLEKDFGGSHHEDDGFGNGYTTARDWFGKDFWGNGEICNERPHFNVEWEDLGLSFGTKFGFNWLFEVKAPGLAGAFDSLDVIEDLVIKVTINGRIAEYYYDDFKFVEEKDIDEDGVTDYYVYKITYTDIRFIEQSDTITLEFYLNGNRVGEWVEWKWDRLPASFQDDTERTDNLKNLLKALYNLGESIKDYIN